MTIFPSLSPGLYNAKEVRQTEGKQEIERKREFNRAEEKEIEKQACHDPKY